MTLFDNDLGCAKGVKAHIQIKMETSRYLHSRPVPLTLRDKVNAELDAMINRGTLRKVKASDWASSLVIVPKPNGQILLCADYMATLAKVVAAEAYLLPRPDELPSALSGNSVFTKLELRACFE